MSRFAVQILFVFALLFAQTGGIVHGIAHAADAGGSTLLLAQQDEGSSPTIQHCELCDAYAQTFNALGSSTIDFIPLQTLDAPAFSVDYFYFSRADRIYSARAPPHSA